MIGAGLAGIGASLLLARSKRKVYLVEKTSYIGGTAIKFEEVFANMECSTCMVAPKQQEVLAKENIELLTLSEVTGITGSHGNFIVDVKKKARYVDMNNCIGCNACFDPCPVTLLNEFEEGHSERKAIYIPCAGTLPNVPCIDTENCIRFKGEQCEACKEACMFEAIDYDQKDEQLQLNVGAIVVATGASTIDPTGYPQFGYGKFENVFSAYEFERMFASNGFTEGNIQLKNGEAPKSVLIIHCVGRKEKGYCSAVCCMYSLKFIHYLRSKIPDIRITSLHSDLCIPGKNYQKFYEKTKEMDVDLIRAKDPEVIDEGITVQYSNENGEKCTSTAEMVILAPAMEPRSDASELAKVLGIQQDSDGFYQEEHAELASIATEKQGIYIAGSAQGPKDIQSSISQAEAAVGRILSTLN